LHSLLGKDVVNRSHLPVVTCFLAVISLLAPPFRMPVRFFFSHKFCYYGSNNSSQHWYMIHASCEWRRDLRAREVGGRTVSKKSNYVARRRFSTAQPVERRLLRGGKGIIQDMKCLLILQMETRETYADPKHIERTLAEGGTT
jgi:hypothetical protein